MREFWSIARAWAGQQGSQECVDVVADRPFVELGYDSLTVIEAVERIESEYGIRVDHRRIEGLRAPRVLYTAVCGGQDSLTTRRQAARGGWTWPLIADPWPGEPVYG
ncbi:acyl carrier protein [Streptomyces sp. NPDC056534]|uniref:acyl carrier protein n=1 Tax=Streptomyces sp. NPDC056534 TaxID=3345857 RepID=UPI003678EA42